MFTRSSPWARFARGCNAQPVGGIRSSSGANQNWCRCGERWNRRGLATVSLWRRLAIRELARRMVLLAEVGKKEQNRALFLWSHPDGRVVWGVCQRLRESAGGEVEERHTAGQLRHHDSARGRRILGLREDYRLPAHQARRIPGLPAEHLLAVPARGYRAVDRATACIPSWGDG